jgi:hypothetical protein
MEIPTVFVLPRTMKRPRQLGFFSPAVLLILLVVSPPAQAGTVLVMTVENASVAPGGPGSFDIVLTNDAAATDSTTIAGFSIDLTVAAASGITFTGADDATSTTYIFAGNSLGFLPTITPTEIQANDFAAIGGTLLAPGEPPVGLAHITFSADLGIAPGVITVTLIDYQAGTSLSNTDGKNLDFTIKNGQITITGSDVPEPSSIILATTSVLLGLTLFRRSRIAAYGAVESATTHLSIRSESRSH